MPTRVKTVVTERPGEVEQPIEAVKMTPTQQVIRRAWRTWLQAFAGALGAVGLFTLFSMDPANPLVWLELPFLYGIAQKVLACAVLALFAAFMSSVQNAVEFYNRTDITNPKSRA